MNAFVQEYCRNAVAQAAAEHGIAENQPATESQLKGLVKSVSTQLKLYGPSHVQIVLDICFDSVYSSMIRPYLPKNVERCQQKLVTSFSVSTAYGRSFDQKDVSRYENTVLAVESRIGEEEWRRQMDRLAREWIGRLTARPGEAPEVWRDYEA